MDEFIINSDTLEEAIHHDQPQFNELLKLIIEHLQKGFILKIIQKYANAPPDLIAKFENYNDFITWIEQKFNIIVP